MSVTAPTRPTRKQLIAERQKRSAVWRVIHWLGSLQLALILLATIGIGLRDRDVCGVGVQFEGGAGIYLPGAVVHGVAGGVVRESLCGDADAVAVAEEAHRVCGDALRDHHAADRGDHRDADGI